MTQSLCFSVSSLVRQHDALEGIDEDEVDDIVGAGCLSRAVEPHQHVVEAALVKQNLCERHGKRRVIAAIADALEQVESVEQDRLGSLEVSQLELELAFGNCHPPGGDKQASLDVQLAGSADQLACALGLSLHPEETAFDQPTVSQRQGARVLCRELLNTSQRFVDRQRRVHAGCA